MLDVQKNPQNRANSVAICKCRVSGVGSRRARNYRRSGTDRRYNKPGGMMPLLNVSVRGFVGAAVSRKKIKRIFRKSVCSASTWRC